MGMAGDFGRQAAKRSGEHIGNRNDGKQSTGDLPARVTRTGNEVLDQECGEQEERQNNAADPPGDGRPKKTQRCVGQKLKKEHTGSDQDGAGEKKTGAENQRDAILGPLEANEGHGGEYKSKQTADDLEISLKKRVGRNRYAAQPVSGKDEKQKSNYMRQENCRAFVPMLEGSLAHRAFLILVRPGWPSIPLDYEKLPGVALELKTNDTRCGFRNLYQRAGQKTAENPGIGREAAWEAFFAVALRRKSAQNCPN
jgi:hypothetical protein